MSFFDFLTLTKRPPAGTKKLSQQELRDALMGLNQPTAPYQLVDGQSEGADLIAEWKSAEAEVSRAFKIYLKFNEPKHEVRALDKEHTVTRKSGLFEQSKSFEFHRGQTYTYSFKLGTGGSTSQELKRQIQDTVTRCGWIYKGVIFGKL